MKMWIRLWNKYKYLGFDKEEIYECRMKMCEDNVQIVNKVSLLLIFLVAVIMGFYLLFDNNPIRNSICFIGEIFMIWIFFTSKQMLSGDNQCTQAKTDQLVYLFSAICFLVGIYMGTFAAGDEMAVAPVWMFFFAILIFNSMPQQNLVVLLFALFVFLICSYLIKSPRIFQYDVMHAITSIIASISMSWEKSRMKVENIIALDKLHNVNIEILGTVEVQEREAKLLRHRASRDELTGFLKKNVFEDMVKDILACSDHNSFYAMVFIDIDNFKGINDNFGHLYGDNVLKDIALMIQNNIDEHSFCGRFGGDEFCIFYSNPETREQVKESIKNIIEKGKITYICNDIQQNISLSAGVAFYPDAGNSYKELFRKADELLYSSKRNGKGIYSLS